MNRPALLFVFIAACALASAHCTAAERVQVASVPDKGAVPDAEIDSKGIC